MKLLPLLAALALVACQPRTVNLPGSPRPGEQMDLLPLVLAAGAQTPISWSVTPGGGTVSANGLYTAPTCAVLLAGLPPGTDVAHTGQITGTDTVTATWPGGIITINISVPEAVLGVEVTPASPTTSPGGTVQFVAVVHYTCHDQTTAP